MAFPGGGVSDDLRRWFFAVDTDRSGRINSRELQAALRNANYSSFSETVCRLMINKYDRDNSGTIDMNEFASLWKNIGDWKACFDKFDKDRSGSINAKELDKALTSFGYNLSTYFCQNLVRLYSMRKTGNFNHATISFDDFIEACVTVGNLTEAFRRYDRDGNGRVTVNFEQFLEMASAGIA